MPLFLKKTQPQCLRFSHGDEKKQRSSLQLSLSGTPPLTFFSRRRPLSMVASLSTQFRLMQLAPRAGSTCPGGGHAIYPLRPGASKGPREARGSGSRAVGGPTPGEEAAAATRAGGSGRLTGASRGSWPGRGKQECEHDVASMVLAWHDVT